MIEWLGRVNENDLIVAWEGMGVKETPEITPKRKPFWQATLAYNGFYLG